MCHVSEKLSLEIQKKEFLQLAFDDTYIHIYVYIQINDGVSWMLDSCEDVHLPPTHDRDTWLCSGLKTVSSDH